MARIPDQELERLKREVSLVRLIEGQGHKLASQGKDLACRCPWHEGDDTPSCVVSPKTNLWHCFGCDAGGSVVDWVMRSHKVSFRHACELLLKEHPSLAAAVAAGASKKISQGKLRQAQSFVVAGSATPESSVSPPSSERPESDATPSQNVIASISASADEAAADQALLDQVIEFYHETLKTSPQALEYFDRRGLGQMELIERFKLGYANRTLAYRLAPKQYKAGAELRAALQRVGILRESGHEHFNGSIVIPLFGESGDTSARPVVGAYGRKVNDNLRAGTPKHLYLPGPHRGVFNREGIKGQQEIILCEALIDALTFWSAGYRNVTSCYGVNGFTDELLAVFKGCGAQRILIAFDRDDAGDRAAEALAKKLTSEGLDCFRLKFPKGMDANAYATSVKPPEKSFGVVIRSAEWLGAGTKKPALTTRCFNSVHQWVDDDEGLRPADLRTAEQPASSAVAESAATPSELPSLAEVVAADLPEPEAAAVPSLPAPEPEAQTDDGQFVIKFGERRYRVRGLPKQLGEALKVNVLVTRAASDALVRADAVETGLHVDTLDLYQAKQRQVFARLAAGELGSEERVIQHDLGRLLLTLEQTIDERAKAAERSEVAPPATMTPEETAAALAFLRDGKLLERIVEDFERVGLVGEPSNALVAYLACVSRKLASPLAVLIQSTSAAGKSMLMDSVLALVPDEDRVHYSAMTGQSLFYLGERDLKHRVLAIAEEEGVRQAAYALKVLQSQGELTIASTGKDPATGLLVTQQYRVEGPVMLFLTTTAIDVDEELVNRCLVLTINESREQTRAIQARQRARRTLSGLMAASEAEATERLHRNAQRLLRPLAVVNPYAEQLTFLDDRTRTRRDHAKYLTLIDAIALLHQHQREVETLERRGRTVEYIEVTLEDIARANALAHEVLGRSLDELPPQTRRVLGVIEGLVDEKVRQEALVRSDVRFTRRELRARCGMSDTAVRIHLERLVAMEYVRAATGRNGQRFEYELLFDGELEASAPQMIGLIDVAALVLRTADSTQGAAPSDTTATSQGVAPDLAPGLPAARTPLAPTSQGSENGASAGNASASGLVPSSSAENAVLRPAAAGGRSPSGARVSRAPASSSGSSFLAASSASSGPGG